MPSVVFNRVFLCSLVLNWWFLEGRRFFWLMMMVFLSLPGLRAAHLVGGELSYTCLGNNRYAFRLVIYRDCASSGAPFDAPAVISIYDGNANFVANRNVFYRFRSNLPITAPNACTSLPPFVCTERAVYLDTFNLPTNSSGYVVSHQRCCRNNSIGNIPAPGTWGNTFTVEIPPGGICNSSPRFASPPPVALCLNYPVRLDLSALEPDGDSLEYSLCELLHGGGNSQNPGPLSPRPDTALPPPYPRVPFGNGFSVGYPIVSNPPFTINPRTGILRGRPTQVGQYVFAICVKEYRNGQLLSTVRRDFQFNVTGSCQGTAAVIVDQDRDSSSLCSGKTINFQELCVNANTYLWDFGDPNTTADTSTLPNPTYTYADTGVYRVRLIANPASTCSDTTFALFAVFDSVRVEFAFEEEACFDLHELNFRTLGAFSPGAQFRWDFGAQTNQGATSNLREPLNLRYLQPGLKVIRLTVTDFECQATFRDTLHLYPRPELRHVVPRLAQCAPVQVQFEDSSVYAGAVSHFWSFGDGTSSIEASPLHLYEEPGTYTVRHRLITREGCLDTLEETFTNQIKVYPVPQAKILAEPQMASIYDPRFYLTDRSQEAVSSVTFLPDGRRISNGDSFVFMAPDTGWFTVVHQVENQFGCQSLDSVSFYVEPPLNFFIPNAFTPNNDGQNDRFSFVLTGIGRFEMLIFNRWGEVVYEGRAGQPDWDGRDQKTGNPLPAGVYSYLLSAEIPREGKTEVIRGFVTLIR